MSFYFEIYTKGPKGETGWRIEVGRCDATNRALAKQKIKAKFKNFDCFLQLYEVSKDFCHGWII